MIDIELANQQSVLKVDALRLERSVRLILQDYGPDRVHLSIAVVDDATIHEVNRQYLQHDYPTDVLSFILEEDEQHLEGEVIASAETAMAQAGPYRTTAADELLLYVIHGVLHLVGFDDQSPETREQMRAAEEHYLKQFGVLLRHPLPGGSGKWKEN